MTIDQLKAAARRKGVHGAKFDYLMQVFGEVRGVRIVEDMIGQKQSNGSEHIDPFWRTAVKGIEIDVDEAIAVLSREMGIPQALVDAMRRKLGRDELYNVLVSANGGNVRFEVAR